MQCNYASSIFMILTFLLIIIINVHLHNYADERHIIVHNLAQSENAFGRWQCWSVIASVSAACGLTTINVTVNNMLPQDIINHSNTILLVTMICNQQLSCRKYEPARTICCLSLTHPQIFRMVNKICICLLYTSDAADE